MTSQLPQPEDDGLVIPVVSEWSRDKHHFLRRYVDAFTTSMKKKEWVGLYYIDLFAGAGIERIKGSGELEWGSPLIAAQARHPFTQLHFCELDPQKCEALNTRLGRIQSAPPFQTVPGDANEKVHRIVNAIPDGSLSVAFLDPYGLHLHFETLEKLSRKRADLIVFFPDRLDILRNAVKYYFENRDSNLDKTLGISDWRDVWNDTPEYQRAEAMRELYCRRIAALGYVAFDYEAIPSVGRRLYWLIFCSKHKKGADIWRRVSLRKRGGQGTFDFE